MMKYHYSPTGLDKIEETMPRAGEDKEGLECPYAVVSTQNSAVTLKEQAVSYSAAGNTLQFNLPERNLTICITSFKNIHIF